MAYNLMPPLLRRWLAGVLAVMLGLGPLAPAYAALTPLADEPLAVKNSAKPNIVLTVDDSTSMLFDFLLCGEMRKGLQLIQFPGIAGVLRG